jgi:hypothetical protein
MTNSESDYFFFPPPKSEYFFQQHWESEYFFRKKTITPSFKLNGRTLSERNVVTRFPVLTSIFNVHYYTAVLRNIPQRHTL